MVESAVEGWLFDRGVWRAPYLVEGYPALIAVDSFGVVRKHVKVVAGVDPIRAADWMLELLDRIDPPRGPKLVRDEPAARPSRVIDPAILNDPRSPLGRQRYIRQLARAAARRLPPRPSDI
jgi:hypothetical protein